MRTLALVESPAQLVNVVEWAHATGADLQRTTVLVLAPVNEHSRAQLRRVAGLAQLAGHTVRWCEPRDGASGALRTAAVLSPVLHGVDRLVLGDPFSGVLQLVLGLSRAREVVLVDDGTATLEFARLWNAGEELVRWHATPPSARRRQVADRARRRLAPGSDVRVSLFTCMPVQPGDLPVLRNDFGWVRSSFATPMVKPTADLVGSSLVETGVVEAGPYLRGLATLAERHQVDRYFAHRLEGAPKLAEIARLGLEVVRPELPLELVARSATIGATLISFPSTVVHTLPLVLRGTSAQLLVCDIAEDWYATRAKDSSDAFLGTVTSTARTAHGLLSVAC